MDTVFDLSKLEEKFSSASYLPNSEILTLTKLALTLDKPILVEGPPGTGKTSLAMAISTILDTQLYRIQCYEGITAEQVIGEFNYQRQLLAIEMTKQTGEVSESDIFTPEYFISRPLLQVLQAEKQVVLLIDEIDRSDEEFEAFLLEALGENQITIPELGTIKAKSNPVVIMTSNGTRDLSGALRRRSLFLALDYPTAKREAAIIGVHVPKLGTELGEKIVSLLRKVRRNDKIQQPPSISEGIELAQALLTLGTEYLEDDNLMEIIGLLAKSPQDQTELKKQLLSERQKSGVEST